MTSSGKFPFDWLNLIAVHAVSAQVVQQVAVRHQQKRRSLALVLMTALLILVSGVSWLAKLPSYIVAIPVILSGIIIGYAAKWTGFSEYTSPTHPERFQRSKTLWDWMQLLLIPVLIAAGGYWFQTQQHNTDTQIAYGQQQETILKTYLDDMSDLLLNHNLRKSKVGDEVSQVARERTLIALRRLQQGRDKTVLQFLQEASLIGIQNAVITLSNADLSGDDLSGADLSGTDLSGATLKSADLNGATLNGANLNDADLSGAHLSGAHWSGAHLDDASLNDASLNDADLSDASLNDADLSDAHLDDTFLNGADLVDASLNGATLNGADLSDAFLNGADLNSTDLSDARNLSQSQLNTVYKCPNGMLPTRLKCLYSPSVVTLTYWYTESPAETPTIRQLIRQFRQQNPGIRIKAVNMQFFVTRAAFIAAVHAGNAPDVLRSDISWVPRFASQGYLLKIDSHVSPSDNLSDYLRTPLRFDEYPQSNGHLYGLPQVTDFLALLYNKAELAKAGINSPPTTMADFETDAMKIVQSKAAPYGFETSGGSYYALPFLLAFGGGMIDQQNHILVNNARSVAGLTFLLKLQNTDQVMPPKVDFSTGYTDMVNDFKSGQTAMIFDGPYEVSNILTGSAFTGKTSNLGIAPIPMVPSGNQLRSPAGGQSYVISAGTKYPDAAYKFISFMSQTSNQAAIARANHTLPTRKSAYQDLGYKNSSCKLPDRGISPDPIISFYCIQDTAAFRPPIRQGAYLFDAFDSNIQAALDGTLNAHDALTAVHDAWEQLLVS